MSRFNMRRVLAVPVFLVSALVASGPLGAAFADDTASTGEPTSAVNTVTKDAEPSSESKAAEQQKGEPTDIAASKTESDSVEETTNQVDTSNDSTTKSPEVKTPASPSKTNEDTNQVPESIDDTIAADPSPNNQDGDAYNDNVDACDSTPPTEVDDVDENGCGQDPLSTDKYSDDDTDGALYQDDNCPFENASGKDEDNDGCIDEGSEDTDRDDDGLLNTEEDVNDNGQVDPGETDPDNANTDGDKVGDKQDKCATVAGDGPDGCPVIITPPAECDEVVPTYSRDDTISVSGGKTSDWLAVYDAADLANQTLINKEQLGDDCGAELPVPPAKCEDSTYQWDHVSEEPARKISDTNGDGIADVNGFIFGELFTVKGDSSECGENPPPTEEKPEVVELDGDCDQVNPMSKVTTPYTSSIGYQPKGSDKVTFLHKEVKAGGYILKLPAVKRGTSFTYSIVVVPADDDAEEKVFGPYTFTPTKKKCDGPNSPPSSNPGPSAPNNPSNTGGDDIVDYSDTGAASYSKAATNPAVWGFAALLVLIGLANRHKLVARARRKE